MACFEKKVTTLCQSVVKKELSGARKPRGCVPVMEQSPRRPGSPLGARAALSITRNVRDSGVMLRRWTSPHQLGCRIQTKVFHAWCLVLTCRPLSDRSWRRYPPEREASHCLLPGSRTSVSFHTSAEIQLSNLNPHRHSGISMHGFFEPS